MSKKLPERVECSVDYCDRSFDEPPYVVATCSRCGHETKSFGHREASVIRALALLREECPEGQENFYVTDDW